MTPQNLQAAFPAATGRDEAAGWIIDRDFLTKIIRRVWKSGRMLAVSSIDVQAILLAAIEIVDEGAAPATPTPPASFSTEKEKPRGFTQTRNRGASLFAPPSDRKKRK